MIVERTYNEAEIKSVITHPDIWPRLTDDFSPKPEDWRPLPGRIYIKGETDELIGIASLAAVSRTIYNSHINVLPEHRGETAVNFAYRVIDWVRENTQARKLVATIPEYHQNVVNFASKVGYVVEGLNTKSILKDGKLHDQIYMGIEI